MLRSDSRALPLMPWPEVQPLPSAAPTPTSSPPSAARVTWHMAADTKMHAQLCQLPKGMRTFCCSTAACVVWPLWAYAALKHIAEMQLLLLLLLEVTCCYTNAALT
jgi:hypothetical protein